MGPELDDLVDEMAALLQAPCTLEDADFNLIGFSGQLDVDPMRQRSILQRRSTAEVREWFHGHGIREATTPVRTPPNPEMGVESRLCVPARHLDRVVAYFWLLDPQERITADLWPDAMRIAETAALTLSHAVRRQARLEIYYRDIVEADPVSAGRAAGEFAAATGLDPDAPVVCVLVSRVETSDRVSGWPAPAGVAWVDDPFALTTRSTSPTVPARDDGRLSRARTTALIARADLVAGLRTAEEVLGRLASGRRPSSFGGNSRIGVGPAVSSLAHLHRSRAGAKVALRVALSAPKSIEPQRSAGRAGAVVWWDALGPARLLSVASDADLADAVLSGRVGEFVRTGNPELVRTARMYLDEAGSAARASANLNIHRQSLYHRLRQIERVTGLDLGSGRDRLELHLALVVAALLEPAGKRP